MSCARCVESVTRALAACAGVESVEVRLEAGRAEVRGSGLRAENLLRAVRELGFAAEEG
jgi:copper chaperone CopZ